MHISIVSALPELRQELTNGHQYVQFNSRYVPYRPYAPKHSIHTDGLTDDIMIKDRSKFGFGFGAEDNNLNTVSASFIFRQILIYDIWQRFGFSQKCFVVLA